MKNYDKTPSATKNDDKSNHSIITVKVSAMWCFISNCLEMFNFTGAVYDEEFSRKLNGLQEYVNGKIGCPSEYDIVGEYVVYELKV